MYHSSYSTGAAEGAAFVAIFLFLLGLVVFGAIASYIINSFLLSRIFKKAGVKSWKAWIPVYNTWRLLELGGQYGWWVLLPLVASTFVGIITLPSSGSSLDPSPVEIFGNIILAGSSITYYVFWAASCIRYWPQATKRRRLCVVGYLPADCLADLVGIRW